MRATNSGNYGWIREVLNWILVAPDSFTIEQMKKAVEMSTGDVIFAMESLLRSECGSLVDLVPVLGTKHGRSYDIRIGHETFQAYLIDTESDNGLFSILEGHGKAALGCIRYLLGAPSPDDCFHRYAIEQWRWHLGKSMGSDPERQFRIITRASNEKGFIVAQVMTLEIRPLALLHQHSPPIRLPNSNFNSGTARRNGAT
jgi:hypothetical protein